MNERRNGLCRSDKSALLIVDIQERLAAAMDKEDRAQVLRRSAQLLRAAKALRVPVFLTEQYPKGLGPTEPDVEAEAEGATRFEKTCFSCHGALGFTTALASTECRQIVIAGMEAHVCVLQTALEFLAERYEVFVVEDAVCSRTAANRDNAMDRLQRAGVIITNTESVVFEWLRDARHEQFKELSRMFR